MSLKRVWHIYHSTRGSSGAYIDALLTASKLAGVHSYAFVSFLYKYKTERAIPLFFPLTDRTEKRNDLIKLFRVLELVAGYFIIFIAALIARPIIIIHLVSPIIFSYYFLILCRIAKIKVCVTCHDIVSHQMKEDLKRRRIFLNAEYLIVHNKPAKKSLIELYGKNVRHKIVQYPFPYRDHNGILSPERLSKAERTILEIIGGKKEYFLFIGVVRRSKGISVLIDGWLQSESSKNSTLLIAGKWDPDLSKFRDAARNIPNCFVIDRYLNDEEYVYLIENSKIVVLPYLRYTHSGVLMSCAWHYAAAIISDIPLFIDLLPKYDLVFQSGDPNKLSKLIDKVQAMDEKDLNNQRHELRQAVEKLDSLLVKRLKETYSQNILSL